MGLDTNYLKFLTQARQSGVALGDVLTVGRLELLIHGAKEQFVEQTLRNLGAKTVESLDISRDQQATIVQNLNQLVKKSLRRRFDTVVDGGTLEHCFDYVQALKNCMEMVKEGGRLFIHSPTNNWCGHGFYQPSPELFYAAFSPDNGFKVERMVIHRVGPLNRWRDVANSYEIKERVELRTSMPMMLLVQARRTKVVPLFKTFPQQVDYQEDFKRTAGRRRPQWVNMLRYAYDLFKTNSLRNQKHFRKQRKG